MDINHMEIVVINKEITPGILYDVDIPEKIFFDRLEVIKQMRLKCTESFFRRFQKHDLEFVIFKTATDKYQVYRKNLVHMERSSTMSTLSCSFKRDSINGFSFPWSTRLHGIASVSRFEFKITHNWNIVFERHDNDGLEGTTSHIWFEASSSDTLSSKTREWKPMVLSILAKWGATSEIVHDIDRAITTELEGLQL